MERLPCVKAATRPGVKRSESRPLTRLPTTIPKPANTINRDVYKRQVYIGELASKKDKTTRPQSSRRDIFARGNIKRIVLSGIPWGCEGMGVYGIGIFTPVLLLTLGLIPESGKAFPRVVESLRFTFYINSLVSR